MVNTSHGQSSISEREERKSNCARLCVSQVGGVCEPDRDETRSSLYHLVKSLCREDGVYARIQLI